MAALPKAILLAVAASVAGFVYYRTRPPAPCMQPILYSVGAIDPRFEVTFDALLASAEAATSIWSQAAGRELFGYKPGGPLKLNLVYDEREANAKFGASLPGKEAEQQNARSSLENLQSWVGTLQANYNREVERLNAAGGATQDQIQRLEQDRAQITMLADSLKRMTADFNANVRTINAGVDRYNETAGKTLRAGVYIRDSAGQRIELYKFVTDTELVRFLAHEFGHALGIKHTPDPNSIMYDKNESGNLSPTAADKDALRAICKP